MIWLFVYTCCLFFNIGPCCVDIPTGERDWEILWIWYFSLESASTCEMIPRVNGTSNPFSVFQEYVHLWCRGLSLKFTDNLLVRIQDIARTQNVTKQCYLFSSFWRNRMLWTLVIEFTLKIWRWICCWRVQLIHVITSLTSRRVKAYFCARIFIPYRKQFCLSPPKQE